MRRIAIISLALGLVLTAATPTLAAGTTYTDSAHAIEVAATNTQGTFTGVAAGNLPGPWETVVDHTNLTASATITGGTFTLYTAQQHHVVTVRGTYTGGTVTQTGGFQGCVNQTYIVAGQLGSVGIGSGGTGTGAFTATLTHYRTPFWGKCVTYGATVSGTISLTY